MPTFTPKPLRFSAQITGPAPGKTWADTVRFFEDHGFSSISVPDHLSAMLPQWSPFVALGAAAMVTSTLRLAITVIDTDFHHPAILAKEVATLDQVSGGRLDLGLGAGWLERDYVETGIAWERPGRRIARLAETIEVLKPLLRGDPLTHSGTYFTIDGFQATPSPIQQPVPILIGGGGQRMLTLAARHADIISVITNLRTGARHAHNTRREAFEEQLGWIEAAIGERAAHVTLGIRVLIGEVSDDRQSAAARIGEPRGMSAAEVIDSPFAFVGSLGEIEDAVHAARDRYGISYFTLHADMAEAVAPLVAKLSTT